MQLAVSRSTSRASRSTSPRRPTTATRGRQRSCTSRASRGRSSIAPCHFQRASSYPDDFPLRELLEGADVARPRRQRDPRSRRRANSRARCTTRRGSCTPSSTRTGCSRNGSASTRSATTAGRTCSGTASSRTVARAMRGGVDVLPRESARRAAGRRRRRPTRGRRSARSTRTRRSRRRRAGRAS